jgi:hypothetical protein
MQAKLKQGVNTIYSTGSAFAAVIKDKSVIIWGLPNWGGDSSAVQAELNSEERKGVDTIYSTE